MNKQDYFNTFSSNPIQDKESRKQYYERIGLLLGKSGRTVEEYFPEWDKTYLTLTDSKGNSETGVKINFHQVLPLDPVSKITLDTTSTESYQYDILYPNLFTNFTKTVKPSKSGLHIVASDFHIPYINSELMNSFLHFLEDYSDRIKGFHIAGDYLNMEALSNHNKDELPKRGYSLGLEYEQGNQWLDLIDDTLQANTEKNYLFGNHDSYHDRFFKNVNMASFKDALPNPTQALKLKERGYNVFENWQEDFIQLGKLQIIHGIYLGINPSKTHVDKMNSSVMFGHSHRINSHYSNSHAGFNIGCMCDIDSPGFQYESRVGRMAWKNGFGIVHLEEDGNFQAEVIYCQNNHFYYAGRKY